jgi:hypothetical protein
MPYLCVPTIRIVVYVMLVRNASSKVTQPDVILGTFEIIRNAD